MDPTPDLEQLSISAPASGSFVTPASASIMDGMDGPGHPRLVWAKYAQSPWGVGPYGAHVYGDGYYFGPWGSRHDRERGMASGMSQQLALDNPVIATAIEALVTNAIGTGLTLSSKPDFAVLGISEDQGKTLSRDIEKAWRNWTSEPLECDATGRQPVPCARRARDAQLSHQRRVCRDPERSPSPSRDHANQGAPALDNST